MAKQRSIDVDQYIEIKKRWLPSLVSVAPAVILSARQVFAIPRFSSDCADDGCRSLVYPNTCTCREYPGYNEESLHRRTLPIATAARQETTKRNFASRNAVVVPSGLRYVERIYEGDWQLSQGRKFDNRLIFLNEINHSRYVSEPVNFCFMKQNSSIQCLMKSSFKFNYS